MVAKTDKYKKFPRLDKYNMSHMGVAYSDTLSLSKAVLFAFIVKVRLLRYGKQGQSALKCLCKPIFPDFCLSSLKNKIPWLFPIIDVFLFFLTPFCPVATLVICKEFFSSNHARVELRAGERCQFSRGLEKFSKQFFQPLTSSSYFNLLLLYTIWIVFSNRSLIFSTPD